MFSSSLKCLIYSHSEWRESMLSVYCMLNEEKQSVNALGAHRIRAIRSKTPTRGNAVDDIWTELRRPRPEDVSVTNTETARWASAPHGLIHRLLWVKTSANRSKLRSLLKLRKIFDQLFLTFYIFYAAGSARLPRRPSPALSRVSQHIRECSRNLYAWLENL